MQQNVGMHKRLIAPRWFERKERSTVFGEPHPPIQTHTHSSTCLVCATIATTCVCPLFGCVFVVCITRGMAQSKHQALVMPIASSKPINLNPHHVHVFVLCSCNNSAWSLVQHGCLLNVIADAGVWLFTLVFKAKHNAHCNLVCVNPKCGVMQSSNTPFTSCLQVCFCLLGFLQ